MGVGPAEWWASPASALPCPCVRSKRAVHVDGVPGLGLAHAQGSVGCLTNRQHRRCLSGRHGGPRRPGQGPCRPPGRTGQEPRQPPLAEPRDRVDRGHPYQQKLQRSQSGSWGKAVLRSVLCVSPVCTFPRVRLGGVLSHAPKNPPPRPESPEMAGCFRTRLGISRTGRAVGVKSG